MGNTDFYDVVIVGGGPIGLELAAACGRRGLTAIVLEAGQIGHTISWWAPGTRWFSSNERIAIAGMALESVDQSKSTREQYLTYLRSVVNSHRLNVRTYTKVTAVNRDDDRLVTSANCSGTAESFRSRAVVLAIGGTDYPNRLEVPGFELPIVDSYFREPHRYWGRRVTIIGGRNSAVEAALRARSAGAEVTLVYRQANLPRESIKYWLLPEIEGLIRTGQIQAYFDTDVVAIEPDAVIVRRHGEQGTQRIPADDVLSLIGYQQDKTLLRACGVDLMGPQQAPRFDPETMESNVRGVYVAGTATAGTQGSKYRIFVENCHEHVEKIIDAIGGASDARRGAPRVDAAFEEQIAAMPES